MTANQKTGCDGLSPSTTTSGYKNSSRSVTVPNSDDHRKENTNMKRDTGNITRMNNIRIATINLRTLQDDIKLATVIKTNSALGIDILSM